MLLVQLSIKPFQLPFSLPVNFNQIQRQRKVSEILYFWKAWSHRIENIIHINAKFERLLNYFLWQQKYMGESHYEHLNYQNKKKVIIKPSTLLNMQQWKYKRKLHGTPGRVLPLF